MNLTYAELTLRDAVKSDCEQLAVWWNDGKVMAHAGFPNGLGTDAREIWEKIKTDSDDTRRRLIIEYRGSRIGEMSYSIIGGGAAEIGIKICESGFQERGLGRIALSMLAGELFRRGCAKIVLDTNLKNARAQHVYELLGFKKLRVNCDSWTDQLGQKQSSVDYELAPGDFNDYTKQRKQA